MKILSTPLLAQIIALAFPLLCPVARAADINWTDPQDISGNSDVSTTGNVLGAFNVGDIGVPGSTSLNGVNFQGFVAPGGNGSVGNFTLVSGFSFSNNTASGSTSAPFANLSTNYQTLLMSRVAGLSPFSLVITGLIVGTQYQFQSWTNNSSGTFGYGTSLTGGNNTSSFLSGNTQGMPGGLGQFIIGTFTADSATQTIGYGADEVAYLNAFQLRRINSASAVSDSGNTMAMLAGAAGVIALLRAGLMRQAVKR